MAKSKTGGSRAYIRGRIGSDVYSVGKDGMGKRQQVVRSLAEQVSNPRTQSQMVGRMIMSTVMQAVSAMSPIIDHSFDGIAKGQPSISEFIRLNYALVKADAAAHPATGNAFGLNKYQEKGVKAGAYTVSKGSVTLPSTVVLNGYNMKLNKGAGTFDVQYLRDNCGFDNDGYLTWVAIQPGTGFVFCRVKLDPTIAGSTVVDDTNVSTLFTYEGNCRHTVSFVDGQGVVFEFGESAWSGSIGGIIISQNIDGAWKHNTCVLATPTNPDFAADTALPTYPTGTSAFLNGGDL